MTSGTEDVVTFATAFHSVFSYGEWKSLKVVRKRVHLPGDSLTRNG